MGSRKAIAYVSDVILGRTGEVISREQQRAAIRQAVQESGVEVVAWFEDEAYNEDVLSRPGIQALLACEERCDTVLVERVWSLSRNWKVLEGFLTELKGRGVRLESTATLWDCVSQMARHFTTDGKRVKPVAACELVAATEACRIRRPERFHFLNLGARGAR
jgi:DNA invertase Pin-like site-specific DNA recombinase